MGNSDMRQDQHTSDSARATRPGALRDLRFAGTVAACLVAAVLGVGALAAPLVDWSDWPKGPGPESDGSVRLAEQPADRGPRSSAPGSGVYAAPVISIPVGDEEVVLAS